VSYFYCSELARAEEGGGRKLMPRELLRIGAKFNLRPSLLALIDVLCAADDASSLASCANIVSAWMIEAER